MKRIVLLVLLAVALGAPRSVRSQQARMIVLRPGRAVEIHAPSPATIQQFDKAEQYTVWEMQQDAIVP